MIIASVLSLAFFGLSVKRPVWAYGLILSLLPIYIFRFSILGIPTTALELMVGVFLFATLVTNFKPETWKKISKLSKINLIVGSFALAGLISTLVSPEPTKALGQLKAFIVEPILMFYAAIIIIKSKKDTETVLKFLFWTAGLISLFGLFQYFTHLFLPLRFWGNGEEVKRITSIFEYPNAFALYLAPLFVMFFTLFSKGYNLGKKYWVATALSVMALAIVLTYSRGAWLGILAGIVVLSLRQTRVSLKHWRSIVLILIVVASPVLLSRFKSTFNDTSSSERIMLYKAGASKLMQDPVFGNGLYGFRSTLENTPLYQGEILNYPHNIILNFWLEMGLLGVLAFALLIFFSAREYKNNPTVVRFSAGLFLLVLVTHGMVDAPYFKNDLSILFWFALSLFYVKE